MNSLLLCCRSTVCRLWSLAILSTRAILQTLILPDVITPGGAVSIAADAAQSVPIGRIDTGPIAAVVFLPLAVLAPVYVAVAAGIDIIARAANDRTLPSRR